MKLIDEFMDGLYNCDKVIVKATGIGEKEYSTVEIYDAIDELRQHKSKPTTEINIDYYEELKRKADIGEAIIKWFNSGRVLDAYGLEIWTIEEFIDWAESEDK